MKFLIDECLHVSLVGYAQERGHEAHYVSWLGLTGAPDWKLIELIVDQDFTMVTNDAEDFSELYARLPLHAGLVILVPQVPPELQLILFEAALRTIAAGSDPPINEAVLVRLTEGVVDVIRYPLSSGTFD